MTDIRQRLADALVEAAMEGDDSAKVTVSMRVLEIMASTPAAPVRAALLSEATGEPNERLRQARVAAGFASATDAARANGWAPSTYMGHENGSRGLGVDVAKEYAKAFGIEWPALLESAATTVDLAAISPEALTLALKQPGRTQAALADRLGVDKGAVSRMCKGQRGIDVSEIPVIAGYLAETETQRDVAPLSGSLAERIASRLAELNMSEREASIKAGLGPDGIRTIRNGHAPSAARLSALASVLDVGVGDLMPRAGEGPGDRLRSARKAAGLSAIALAAKVGLSVGAVRNQENGTNGIPATLAPEYAKHLDVTPEWILYGRGDGLQ